MVNNEYFDVFDDESTVRVIKVPDKLERRTTVMDEMEKNGTRHEAVVPVGVVYTPLPEDIENPAAKIYPFELDDFQKISVCSLERDESVLVSAHTSSGKTVVAEYAIAMSLKNKQRVVYTSPIKALSNQKYRELLSEFSDVGLMTGDVTINPMASCLVMTTEILRNMLYRGSEVIREVHWIIFDEIHYMRDKERGVVWEETIILLPKHVRMVFLSATIPNALEFAEWICHIQKQVVHVVYTERRVTPLVHYFRTNKLYKIKDTKFHKSNFLSAMRSVQKRNVGPREVKEAIGDASLPAVVFSFRRKDCEKFAMKLNESYLTDEEVETVKKVFTNAIGSLRKEDREIPIIQNILPLLTRGIGIHHSGLLPIIKEVVEILFQEGFLKVLFATETFSIGLNMPAKSVIFTALRKFDGESMRLVSSGEYIQMSGRAGRRGIDSMGIVISIVSEVISYKDINKLFSSSADNLVSAFRLTYNMILNLMRVEELDPLYLISRSFHHFQAYKKALVQEEVIHSMYKRLEDRKPSRIVDLFRLREEKRVERNRRLQERFAKHLKKGRVVDLFIPRNGASIVVKNAIVSRAKENVSCVVQAEDGVFMCKYPLHYVDSVYNNRVKLDMRVFARTFEKITIEDGLDKEIDKIEAEILGIVPEWSFDTCIICGMCFRRCLSSCGKEFLNGEVITINEDGRKPKEDSNKPKKSEAAKLCSEMKEVREYFLNESLKQEYHDRLSELNRLKEVYHMEECKKMLEVLEKLGYCDGTTVLIKGRMACEISTGDELLLTEMIFNGDFAGMPVEHLVPLLSCVIFEEWDSNNFVLNEENKACYNLIVNSVEKICRVLKSCSIDIDPAVYLRRFSYELMDVVRMWVCGHTFISICEKTGVFEGSIIRTFKRLEELLRQLSGAARVIGNVELENMFALGIAKIKRDIVFANSLYL